MADQGSLDLVRHSAAPAQACSPVLVLLPAQSSSTCLSRHPLPPMKPQHTPRAKGPRCCESCRTSGSRKSCSPIGPAPARCVSVPRRVGCLVRDDHEHRPDRVLLGAGLVGGARLVWRRSRLVLESAHSRIDCGRVGVHAWTTVQALARDLPGTAPRVPSRRPLAQSSAPPFTCAVVWGREVLCGGVNDPSIDGKDGVAGSIPAGGSTQALTSGNAGQLSFRGGMGWAHTRSDGVRASIHRSAPFLLV
jgi:hypothetical protein